MEKINQGRLFSEMLEPIKVTNYTVRGNDGIDYNIAGPETDYYDFVTLDSRNDIRDLSDAERRRVASDYAIANGVWVNRNCTSNWGEKGAAVYRVLSKPEEFSACVDVDGSLYGRDVGDMDIGVAPLNLRLNLEKFCEAQKSLDNFGQIDPKTHTFKMGRYAQHKAENSEQLEELYNRGMLTPADRKYKGIGWSDDTIYNDVYEYEGKCYVRVDISKNKFKYDSISTNVASSSYVNLERDYGNYNSQDVRYFNNGEKMPDKGVVWFVEEQMELLVKNWNELPEQFNPNGTGTAKYLDVQTKDIILGGTPFRCNKFTKGAFKYELSTIRAYINGLDLGCGIGLSTGGGDFSKTGGFLGEALGISPEQIKEMRQRANTKLKTLNATMTTTNHKYNEPEYCL